MLTWLMLFFVFPWTGSCPGGGTSGGRTGLLPMLLWPPLALAGGRLQAVVARPETRESGRGRYQSGATGQSQRWGATT